MEENKTVPVVFRKYKDGEIIALFPSLKWSDTGNNCTSYQHIGQHGAADYGRVIYNTVRANPSEYYDLLKELEGMGYKLKIKKAYHQPRG